MLEKTLLIIKPDGVKRKLIGKIISIYENYDDIDITNILYKKLSIDEAKTFYDIHKERPFFNDLINYMTSSPVVLIVLSGENIVKKNRKIIGNTDPSKADENTVRKLFGINIEQNTVHGSDSVDNAKKEISIFWN